MKSVKITLLLVATVLFASLGMAQNASAYIHKAEAGNIVSSKTILDTNGLNGNSVLKLLVTHNYNPGGGAGLNVNKPIGFRFQSLKWYIITQDNSAFTPNTYFNVFIPDGDVYAWAHTSSNANNSSNYTEIDDGRINNNPNAKVFIANNLANYNNNVNGVFYRTSSSKWCIFNQDHSNSMEENLEFNIIVPKANTGFKSMLHTADGNNTSNHFTYLNHPDLNGNPEAIIFLTQVWNPGGTQSGVYNNHNVGVEYNSNNKWRIINEDLANMPLGASFNVIVFKNNTIGINEISISKNHVKLFPNPAKAGNHVIVELDDFISGFVKMEIYSLSGERVAIQEFEKSEARQQVILETKHLVRGMYILKVVNNGKAGAQKLIIN